MGVSVAMKRIIIIALLLTLTLSALPASAVPLLSSDLIQSAIVAVDYLSSGEYERLVTLLPFSGVAPGASEWERFSRNYGKDTFFSDGSATAYWKGGHWNIAVPILSSDSEAEALVLSSEDGCSFTGYRYATWGEVEAAYSNSSHVLSY